MTNVELKDALMDGRRVVHNGIEYERVHAIVYKNVGGSVMVSAELIDKNNCLVVAEARKIKNVGGEQ